MLLTEVLPVVGENDRFWSVFSVPQPGRTGNLNHWLTLMRPTR
jgi:hypothetical protein